MNNAKFFILSGILLFSGLAFASDDPASLLPDEMSDNSGNASGDDKDRPSESSSFLVVPDAGDDAHDAGERAASRSGTSSGSGSSGDLGDTGDSGDSDDSDDFMIDTTKKWWQSAREKIKKYPYLTACGVLSSVVAGLYKYNKPFRTKVNAARDTIKSTVREFWKKQQEKPLTLGFLLKTGAAGAVFYGVQKSRLIPTLATPLVRSANYIESLNFSQKCLLGVGVACTTLGLSWLYKKFSKVKPQEKLKPAAAEAK